MKPLSPSSTASVASTSTSYVGATGSCLVGVLRRIFRSSSLPEFHVGYASAKAEEFGNRKEEEEEVGAQVATPVPGIVARLMGLESLPQIMKIHGENSPGSVTRSRSMNDLDYGEKCEEDGDPRSSVKSTSSFRETPTYLEIENEEFLVLIFENGTETEDGSSSGKRRRRKRRRNRTSILVKNESNSWGENSAVEQTPEPAETSSLTKLRNVKSDQQEVVPMDKQAEIECGSENSLSPVSVLESSEFVTSDLDTSTSAEDSEGSNEHGDRSLLHTQRSRHSGTGSRRKDISSYLNMQILSCSREVFSHNGKWKYEEASGDICAGIEGQILEGLIDDLIDDKQEFKIPKIVEPPY